MQKQQLPAEPCLEVFPEDPDFPQLKVASDPDRMLVEIFPYDRRLRNLGPVLCGALSDIEPLLLARLGPGQWRAEERNIEPTRYRTELGAALKCTMQARDALTARNETLRCYLKVYRDQRGEETFQLLRSLSEKAANGQKLYSVVGPITYLSELRTLVLEEAPGTSLQQLLLHRRDAAPALSAVARAVRGWNRVDWGPRRVVPSAVSSGSAERRG